MRPCLTRNLLKKRLRPIAVPRDLEAITDIDDEREVPAGEAGLAQADVDAIWEPYARVIFTLSSLPLVNSLTASLCLYIPLPMT